jgi:cytochrome oxidase Cu insertion factor (SCO1/SenC/PrrC family)
MPGTTRSTALTAAIVATLSIPAATASSQNNPAPSAAGPAINAAAPDFTLTGATRYGVLKNPVRLSDFRGRTVVLAFFFQARTKG